MFWPTGLPLAEQINGLVSISDMSLGRGSAKIREFFSTISNNSLIVMHIFHDFVVSPRMKELMPGVHLNVIHI